MTKYSIQNVFVRIDKQDKYAVVGLSELFSEELDVVEYVDLPQIGEVYGEDDLFTIDTVSDTFHFISPISGEIVEVNKELEDNPKLISEDPEFSGWICKIKLSNKSEFNEMMTFDQYRKYLNEEDEFYD